MRDENTTRQTADTTDSRERLVPVLRGVLPGDRTLAVLVGERWLVGRGEECEVRLERGKVSRKHAELRRQGPVVAIRDLGSTNGTYVDGARIEHGVLAPGCVLRIGEWLGVVEELPARHADVRFKELAPGIWGAGKLGEAVETLARAASSTLPVLLVGRTGTGKERFARALHDLSARYGPLHAINCAALPAALAEAELFGYQRGAFTGAERASRGHLRAADGGTLFLDEVGDLPLPVQAKLLRALDSGETAPLGDASRTRFDARLVAACHEPVNALVQSGRLRQDFAARLAGVTIELTALCERRGDVPGLFELLLRKHSANTAPAVSVRLYERLCLWHWPNNVREVELLARQMLTLHGHESRLRCSHLPEYFKPAASDATAVDGSAPNAPESSAPESSDAGKNSADVAKFASALRLAGGNVTAAAQAAGISRQRAYRLIWSRRLGGHVAAARNGAFEHDDGRDD